jgi:hypothetical protein
MFKAELAHSIRSKDLDMVPNLVGTPRTVDQNPKDESNVCLRYRMLSYESVSRK